MYGEVCNVLYVDQMCIPDQAKLSFLETKITLGSRVAAVLLRSQYDIWEASVARSPGTVWGQLS